MEALVQCRKDHPYEKFIGACSSITYELTNCLKEEKKIVREPRQKRYHELWAKKRQADEERLEQLRQQRTNLADAGGEGEATWAAEAAVAQEDAE